MINKTGGSAFPVVGMSMRHGQGVESIFDNGMTLRDFFAAKAMQALYTGSPHLTSAAQNLIAKAAYEIADSMLVERES